MNREEVLKSKSSATGEDGRGEAAARKEVYDILGALFHHLPLESAAPPSFYPVGVER